MPNVSAPKGYRPYPAASLWLIFQREMRAQGRRLRRWQGIVLTLAGPLAYVSCYALALQAFLRGAGDLGLLLLAGASLLCLLLVVLNTTGAIAREREQHTIDLLLLTPLSRDDIVRGKLLAASAPMALANLGALALVIIQIEEARRAGMTDPPSPVPDELFLLFLPVLVNFALMAFAATAGLVAATFCRSIARAISVTVALITALLLPGFALIAAARLAFSALAYHPDVLALIGAFLLIPLLVFAASVCYISTILRLDLLDK